MKAIAVGVAITVTVFSEKMKTVDPNGELNVAKIARDWKPSYGTAKNDTR